MPTVPGVLFGLSLFDLPRLGAAGRGVRDEETVATAAKELPNQLLFEGFQSFGVVAHRLIRAQS